MPPTTAIVSDSKPHHPSTSTDSATANHHLPARSATEDESQDQKQSDDAATMAASEELRHTTISDKVDRTVHQSPGGSTSQGEDNDMGGGERSNTPEQGELRERLSSPKKKRGRDLEDDTRDVDDTEAGENASTTACGAVNINRTSRSEPEKKRPRDASEEETATITRGTDTEKEIPTPSTSGPKKISVESENPEDSSTAAKHVFGGSLGDKPQSSSAFMSSGFGALSSSTTSPFGTVGASKPSIFGGGTQTAPSGFGALAAAKQTTTSPTTASVPGSEAAKPATAFAFGAGSSTSGFGTLGSGSVFGSAISNGFAGGSGPKLSSFAAPGKLDIAPSKPAKPFGAPDSDEDESDNEDSDVGADGEEEGSTKGSEDRKKSKAVRTHIEDGESGEATLLQIRAKLFAIDSKEKGWQERGVGTLKLNVPEPCVSFDDGGVPIPGSFDVSGIEDEDGEESAIPRVPRLIMRQENTHRVILNTIIVRAMEFKDKPSTTGAQVLFTAFENDNDLKPISMLLKMSESNFKLFRSEIDSVQHEL